jgi:hypothetical protein
MNSETIPQHGDVPAFRYVPKFRSNGGFEIIFTYADFGAGGERLVSILYQRDTPFCQGWVWTLDDGFNPAKDNTEVERIRIELKARGVGPDDDEYSGWWE